MTEPATAHSTTACGPPASAKAATRKPDSGREIWFSRMTSPIVLPRWAAGMRRIRSARMKTLSTPTMPTNNA